MDFIFYFFTGLFVAIIGALPLGTINVAVINTTIRENITSALKIVFPAALGELLLIFVAIVYYKSIQDFITQNTWLQYIIAGVLLIFGLILIFGKKNCIKDDHGECIAIKPRVQLPKEVMGFVLGLLNPSVLIYWLFAISYLGKKMILLEVNTALTLLMLFFAGAFIGKASTLYGYGEFSHILKMKIKNITAIINKVIGSLLLLVAFIQLIKIVC